MAANLAGMFAQLNNAIQGTPQGVGLLNQASRGLGSAASTLTGSKDPYAFMNQGGKQLQAQEDLGALDMTTSAGLAKAGQIYGKLGDPASSLQFQQAALEQQRVEQQLKKEQQLRESLANKALKLGLPDMADQIVSGATDLKEDAKKLQELEIADMVAKRGLPARKALAKRAGLTAAQFEDEGLGTMTDDQFQDYMKGMGAEVKGYQRSDGSTAMLKTNKYGQVMVGDQWVSPSEAGLRPAPQISRIHNVSNKMVEELAMQGVENFNDLFERANMAVEAIGNVDRVLPLVDHMSTGLFGTVEQTIKRAAEELGFETNAANAEVFIAEAGKRVAQEIQAFGSGTGLSDKDREYAEKMAAGRITVTPEALKRILNIRKASAEGTLKNYEETKTAIGNKYPDSQVALDLYVLRQPTVAPPPQPRVRTYDPVTRTLQ